MFYLQPPMASNQAEQLHPEPIAGALIFDSRGKIFLTKSHKWHDKYVIPGGHIGLGERAVDALRREIKEETGLEICLLSHTPRG